MLVKHTIWARDIPLPEKMKVSNKVHLENIGDVVWRYVFIFFSLWHISNYSLKGLPLVKEESYIQYKHMETLNCAFCLFFLIFLKISVQGLKLVMYSPLTP